MAGRPGSSRWAQWHCEGCHEWLREVGGEGQQEVERCFAADLEVEGAATSEERRCF